MTVYYAGVIPYIYRERRVCISSYCPRNDYEKHQSHTRCQVPRCLDKGTPHVGAHRIRKDR